MLYAEHHNGGCEYAAPPPSSPRDRHHLPGDIKGRLNRAGLLQRRRDPSVSHILGVMRLFTTVLPAVTLGKISFLEREREKKIEKRN